MVLKDTFVDSADVKFQLIVRVPTPAELGARRLSDKNYKGPEDAWKLVPYTLQLVVDAQVDNGPVTIVMAENKHQCGTGAVSWDMRQALDRLVEYWVMQFITNTILPKTFIDEPCTTAGTIAGTMASTMADAAAAIVATDEAPF